MWSSKLDYDYFFDQTPTKIDKWVPGTGLKIQDFSKIENIEKVLVVIGAWNFSEEIVAKIQAIRGKKETIYLKYYPEMELID